MNCNNYSNKLAEQESVNYLEAFRNVESSFQSQYELLLKTKNGEENTYKELFFKSLDAQRERFDVLNKQREIVLAKAYLKSNIRAVAKRAIEQQLNI